MARRRRSSSRRRTTKKRTIRRKGGIQIKASRRGSLRRIAKTPKGKKIPVSTLRRLARSKNPKIRRKAQFALNARKFKH